MPESATTSARFCSVDAKDLSIIEVCMMNKFATETMQRVELVTCNGVYVSAFLRDVRGPDKKTPTPTVRHMFPPLRNRFSTVRGASSIRLINGPSSFGATE